MGEWVCACVCVRERVRVNELVSVCLSRVQGAEVKLQLIFNNIFRGLEFIFIGDVLDHFIDIFM